ncbi:MAG: LLM class flavin-dependent oxidoreductase [Actinomycetota bacterium]
MSPDTTYGLFLNMGENIAGSAQDVVRLTIEQAQLAEELGFHDLWLTEHHFIPFGINPSALTAAAFLLGRTERIRVGTAVTLSPLYHPIELAERAALLDQMSGGRFDLGIGRGGYLKDYEVLDVDPVRWTEEPLASATTILDAWVDGDLTRPDHTTGPSRLQPPPLTGPHPPLFLATRSPEAITFAAERGLPLQHYFAVPVEARVAQQQVYAEANPAADVAHLHTLIVVATDDEPATREHLAARLTESFIAGHWPNVPGAGSGHADADGKPLDRSVMARRVAEGAIIGTPAEIRAQLAEFQAVTGARRLAFYVEAIADADVIRNTIAALAPVTVPG